MDKFDFFGPNLAKNGFKFEIKKKNLEIRINILEIPCMPTFRQNKQL